MEDDDNLVFKDGSLDELISHLASDIQGDRQFNHIRFPQTSATTTQRMGPEFSNENVDPAFLQRRNVYFHDNYQNHHHQEQLSFMLNPPREDVMPGIMSMHGGDYVIFGTPNAQNTQSVHNLHYLNKTNGTLTGFNDYGVEYTGSDYNLFSGISPQRDSTVPQFPGNGGKI